MKYIRTKDGIYETTRENEIAFMVKGSRGYEISKLKDRVIKEANTIPELCDRFVVEFKHSEKQPSVYRDDFHTLEEVYEFVNEYSRRCIIVSIKGAIWTDNGLIYVAEMNEKRDWELL